jgi:hypothetical protein
MVLYALVFVYVNHFLALGQTRYVVPLAVVFVLQQALFLISHDTGPHIIAVQLGCAALLLVLSELFDRWSRARGRSATPEPATAG